MRRTIFYSWQSDLPNKTNRGLIQTALETATKNIASDDSINVDPVVDRDTQGVPGAPDITATILRKIDEADIFVADVSIIGRTPDGRPTPNPNVMIELGYAMKSLGHDRIILISNTAYGKPEELPFDLRTRRVTSYSSEVSSNERTKERKDLSSRLEAMIRAGLDAIPATPSEEPALVKAMVSIEEQRPGRLLALRKALESILTELLAKEPKKFRDGGTVKDLDGALRNTEDTVGSFASLAEIIGVMGDTECALETWRWLGNLFDRYTLPADFNGSFNNADFDYYKFLGHELLVTITAFALKERKWDMLIALLNEPIPVTNSRRSREPDVVEWTFASEHLPSLLDEGTRSGRLSVQGDILNERHASGPLKSLPSMSDFTDADFFLFLRAEVSLPEFQEVRMPWRPWSSVYLRQAPMFLRRAQGKQIAEELARVLGAPNVPTMKERLTERAYKLSRLWSRGWWDLPLSQEDIDKIGTK